MLLSLLIACLGGGDSGKVDDSGETGEPAGCGEPDDTALTRDEGPVSFEDADETCDRRWEEADAGGCGWGYLYLEEGTRRVELELDLPAEDWRADHDWIYTLPVGGPARLDLLELDGGPDTLDFWSCSDYTESFAGTLWRGVSGEVVVEARWLCDTVDPWCYDEEAEIHAVIRLIDVALESSTGECRALEEAEYRVTLGVTDCGG